LSGIEEKFTDSDQVYTVGIRRSFTKDFASVRDKSFLKRVKAVIKIKTTKVPKD
jgi:hypothetical protein